MKVWTGFKWVRIDWFCEQRNELLVSTKTGNFLAKRVMRGRSFKGHLIVFNCDCNALGSVKTATRKATTSLRGLELSELFHVYKHDIRISDSLKVQQSKRIQPLLHSVKELKRNTSSCLDDRGSRVRFPAGAGNFSLHHRVKNGSRAHPASYQWVPGALSLGVKRSGREADHSPSSSAQVKE
jgi:hypothetical protein